MNPISSLRNYSGSPSHDDLRSLARDIVRRELKKESPDIPNTSKVYKKIDSFLNLGSEKGMDLTELTEKEKEQFYKMLAALVKEGIVGYHEYEVDGKREKHYIVNELGNRKLYGKKLWRDK